MSLTLGGTGRWHGRMCRSHPACHRSPVVTLFSELLNVPFCPGWFPCLWGNSQEPFLFFSSLPGVQVPSHFLFFSPFHLPGYLETFLVLSSVWGLLLVFDRCSLRVIPFLDVFLMYLWEGVSSMSLDSAIWIGVSRYFLTQDYFHFTSSTSKTLEAKEMAASTLR